MATNAITSTKIADGSIVDADVSTTAAIAYSKLNLINSIQNQDIVANAITTSKVANGTVTTSKLADSAVSGLKLLTYAVTNRHLAPSSVSTDKIDPTGASSGNVLLYNGTNVAWGSVNTSPTGTTVRLVYDEADPGHVHFRNFVARVLKPAPVGGDVTVQTFGALGHLTEGPDAEAMFAYVASLVDRVAGVTVTAGGLEDVA